MNQERSAAKKLPVWFPSDINEAVKEPRIQLAAKIEASRRAVGAMPKAIHNYKQVPSKSRDPCQRYEEFLSRATDEETRNWLFHLHVENFECPDLTKHQDEVIRLAKMFFQSD